MGAQLLKDPTTKIFYDKFQLKISAKKVLEILENRLKKSIETTNETLNAFNTLDSQAIDGNAISNSVGLNPIQENEIVDNSVELNSIQEQTAQEQDTQENAQTTIKQETPTAPTIPLNPKIDFKPSEEILIKGTKTRYKANIKAIELLKELQAKQEILKGDYYATQEEQEILAQFSGWGGLESYFKKDQRPEEFKELNALLTKDEFRRAYSSTRDAYYTPKLVIDSIYQALDQLGFNNDNHQKEIFEPSLGTGKFIAHAPSDKNYRFMGTELDPISANISKFLYPNQVITNTALENHQFYQEYDAFVGNPPYGNHKIYSSNDKELSNESVHNYFLGKAIKELKDDGIGAFVVSSWFMDGKNPKMREHIAQNATFLGAIRLPNSVFKATGAEVSSDIVFFKKGVDEATNQSFTKAMPYYDKIIDSLDDDTLFALQNNRFDSFIPSDQLKIVNAIASHFGFKQEKLQRWYEKIDTANFGYKEQDHKVIKDFIDKVGKNNINLNEQTLNEYFIHHPENILGHLSLEKTRYSFEINGEQIYKYELQALEDKSLDLSQALNQAIEKLPKDVYQYHKTTLKTDALIIDANNERYQEVQKLIKNLERGELVKWDNLYFQLEQNNEIGIFLKPTKINSKVQDSRLKAYFKIKDALNDLTSTELSSLSSDLELESKRVRLNLVYDEFVKKFGYLNENKNRKDIKQDLYGTKVLGLEKDFEKEITPRSAKMQNIEPRQAQAKKAQIFFERTLNPKKELIITNAKEALIASINQKGCLDLHFIRDHFTTQSLETTIKELLEQKLIYKDHKDNGDYVLANDYLSANVKRKLKEVKEAINQGVEGLEANVKDLELIIPKDLKATEIMANINSPWIPTQYLEEFLVELAANHYEKQYGDKMTDYQLGNLKEDINDTFNNSVLKTYDGSQLELEGFNHHISLRPHQKNAIFRTIQDRVVLNKRVFKVEAHGFYFRNNATNSIDIEITSLLRDNQSFPLTSPAKTSLKIPPNAKIKKSTLFVLKGENAEEVAQFIGVADENGKYNEGSIIDRMQKCEGKKSKKGQDNILSCTTDARKVALDYRLIDPNAKVEKEFSKSYAMAKNIYENYLETNATKGTQLGFIGLSTPKTHSQKVSLEALDNAHEIENKNPLDEAQELLESLSSYDENGNLIAPSKKELENELKEKEAKSVNLDEELAKSCSFDVYSDVLRHLVQMGIPQNEIAFIHDAKTEEQKQDLFKKINRGEVRVLLGSPAKMGVGTNVQARLVAMHELDCPWRPDELLQMEGRGIRQGNILHQNDPENFRMKIYRYATEKTYDSRMWQIIETKSKGIEQFRNAHKLGLNELEDFNMGSSNASEMKAEATGNPLIIEEVKLRAEIKNEEAKYKAFNKENYFNEENLKNNSSKLDYLKQELKDLETLQSSVMIPTHTEIKLYDLKNEESKDYELIKVKEVEPLKENASMSEELTHKKIKEQNKQIAEQNKEKLDAIKKQFASNLNDLFFNEERDCKLLEYKGFVVNAYKTKYQVEFSLSPKDNPNVAYSPSNMVYKNDTANMFRSYNFCGEIKFDGFLKRLDNAITKLPEKIKESENSIKTTQENIAKYTRLVEQKPPYPRLEYLQALKWDHKTLIDDLAKMSKNRDYKPVFNPKSQEILEKMNAEKRASLENESVTEEIREQANQEAHRPMKKAANDDYDMGM
ncbi:hypothetical protein HpBT166_02240 [Helicobacter pylori]